MSLLASSSQACVDAPPDFPVKVNSRFHCANPSADAPIHVPRVRPPTASTDDSLCDRLTRNHCCRSMVNGRTRVRPLNVCSRMARSGECLGIIRLSLPYLLLSRKLAKIESCTMIRGSGSIPEFTTQIVALKLVRSSLRFELLSFVTPPKVLSL